LLVEGVLLCGDLFLSLLPQIGLKNEQITKHIFYKKIGRRRFRFYLLNGVKDKHGQKLAFIDKVLISILTAGGWFGKRTCASRKSL